VKLYPPRYTLFVRMHIWSSTGKLLKVRITYTFTGRGKRKSPRDVEKQDTEIAVYHLVQSHAPHVPCLTYWTHPAGQEVAAIDNGGYF
jgi:hypothetical protein